MKLLLFSDLHSVIDSTQSIVDRADEFDVIVGAGDFGRCRYDLEPTIETLESIKTPAILVAGNNESYEELSCACENWPAAHVLHGTGVSIAGVAFFGVGGGIPVTPFGAWSWDFTEDAARKLFAGCPEDCVLVTHSPPREVVDKTRGGHFGSEAIRETVLKVTPKLLVCGHVHDCWGQTEQLGNTPIVNAGPSGVEWELR